MNVSSAIAITKNKNNSAIINSIKAIEGCDVPVYEQHKLVVAIIAENISAEINIIKKIESISGVVSIQLIYSYSEDELNKEMNIVENGPDYPEWLNEYKEAHDIPYSGKLKI